MTDWIATAWCSAALAAIAFAASIFMITRRRRSTVIGAEQRLSIWHHRILVGGLMLLGLVFAFFTFVFYVFSKI